MNDIEKLTAVKNYVYENFSYSKVKCTNGAKILLVAARNLGLDAHYRFCASDYDLYGDKGTAIDTWHHMTVGTIDGHMAVVVDLHDRERDFVIDAIGHQ